MNKYSPERNIKKENDSEKKEKLIVKYSKWNRKKKQKLKLKRKKSKLI